MCTLGIAGGEPPESPEINIWKKFGATNLDVLASTLMGATCCGPTKYAQAISKAERVLGFSLQSSNPARPSCP